MTITITFRDENSGCFKSVDITKEGLIDMITNNPDRAIVIINDMEKNLPQDTNRGGTNRMEHDWVLSNVPFQSFI